MKQRGGDTRAMAFHCIVRVTRQMTLLDAGARDALAGAIRRVADFSGVEVTAYCLLSNHFHVLVRVDPQARSCADDELVRRFRALYGDSRAQCIGMDARNLERLFADPDRAEAAERVRAKLRARMGDVSAFMQTLKHRYTKWFNRARGGGGSLWAERFRSVLVQDSAAVLRAVAAYIDLNAVRAGLVEDPKDYRWCGYAAALAGDASLRAAYGRYAVRGRDSSEAMAAYRLYLMGKGEAAKGDGSGARVPRRVAEAARKRGGHLPADEVLRLKLRFMTEGIVVGDRSFVEGVLDDAAMVRYRRGRAPKPVPSPEGVESFVCARQWSHRPEVEAPRQAEA
ncbi:MAG: transposase [Opitutales bacterium]|nr:transposase [Opitutales bacterium]